MTVQGHTALHDSFTTIKESHSLNGDRENLIEFYRAWVHTYDADVRAQRYRAPGVVADIVAAMSDRLLRRSRDGVRVLDAGCGTGLVGKVLAERGFTYVDGFDLSHQMIAAADLTGAYRTLRGGVDMNQPLDATFPTDGYDVAVCCGVFTVGHVANDSLQQLIAAVRPRGVIVVSTRNSYLSGSGFTEYVDHVVRAGRVRLHERRSNAPYIDEEGASYWSFEVN